MLKTVVAILLISLGFSGLALAGSQSEKYKLVVNLRAKQEVPKPVGAKPNAVGLFSATLVETSSSKKITWKLTYSHLTGKAQSAHIHLGKKGKAGAVAAALCGPCKSGQKGKVTVNEATVKAIESGGAYVNVHTAKNPNGEIRGQIKVSE
jgi:hypothetical protein